MNNKAPSYVDDKAQQRLTLAGMFAHSVSAVPDETMEYLLRNENRSQIPHLVSLAACLGRDQKITITESVSANVSRIAIPNELASEWEVFWKSEYGIKADFSSLQIPTPPVSYKARLLVMHEKGSQSPEMLFQSDKKAYGSKIWKFTEQSLDEVVPVHKITGTFSAWVADEQEAPDGCVGGVNLNTQAVDELGWVTETLPMRQVHGRKFFRERGEHLDKTVWTFCAGSRFSNGYVPKVFFFTNNGGVFVRANNPQFANYGVRFRRVVV